MTCMSYWSTIQLNPLVLTHLKCRSRFIRDLDGENYSRTLTWTMSDCEAPKKELMDSEKNAPTNERKCFTPLYATCAKEFSFHANLFHPKAIPPKSTNAHTRRQPNHTSNLHVLWGLSRDNSFCSQPSHGVASHQSVSRAGTARRVTVFWAASVFYSAASGRTALDDNRGNVQHVLPAASHCRGSRYRTCPCRQLQDTVYRLPKCVHISTTQRCMPDNGHFCRTSSHFPNASPRTGLAASSDRRHHMCARRICNSLSRPKSLLRCTNRFWTWCACIHCTVSSWPPVP